MSAIISCGKYLRKTEPNIFQGQQLNHGRVYHSWPEDFKFLGKLPYDVVKEAAF